MSKLTSLSDKVLLVILDGYGLSTNTEKNSILEAKTPNLDNLFENYPFTQIKTSGPHVGLPEGVYGNSEVGHLNIGAGKRVLQDLVKINEAIDSNILKDMEQMKALIDSAKSKSKRIHLMGLLSDGGVHSHINHIKEIIKIISEADSKIEIFFHAYMDGRDTPTNSGKAYIEDLLTVPGFSFASMQGRSIGMDRDKRYEKVERAYNTLTGKGEIERIDPVIYIQREYDKKIFDEFITPVLFDENYSVKGDDALFFVNFRPDRAIEITQAFTLPDFKEFETPVKPSFYLCMTPYVTDEIDLPILFDKDILTDGLSEYFSKKDIPQFKIAETEKFAHITYFFNGGKKEPFNKEERILIPSPKEVATYDEKPEMSAYPVTEGMCDAIKSDKYTFHLVNFANPDMVGHTGNFEAAVKAVEVVDECVGKLMSLCLEKGVAMVLTADHGNSDQMAYVDGSPHTAHTTSDAPLAILHPMLEGVKLDVLVEGAALKDIAPTLLEILGEEMPSHFEGRPVF